jgi:hypothetical protein
LTAEPGTSRIASPTELLRASGKRALTAATAPRNAHERSLDDDSAVIYGILLLDDEHDLETVRTVTVTGADLAFGRHHAAGTLCQRAWDLREDLRVPGTCPAATVCRYGKE